MGLLASLNPEQQDAVLQTEGPLLILAGAGSGKTRVIAHRIAHLVSSDICPPDRILAVTFTNKAAGEMRSRVETLLGVDCRQMWISTFHALCARLLRREGPHVGLSRDFVIYDSTDQLTVMKQAMRQVGVDDSTVQPRLALSRISHAKNRMEGPEVFTGDSWNPRDRQIGALYELYVKALTDANALDFDDLLLKTVELFERSELVRDKYSEKFRFLMVDEYQDTNRPQYLLIQRLASRHRNLCVVGDPDQSIYKWRGADLRNILDFEHDFPEARTVKLERNYRSTQVILDAASAVIAQNRNRKEKRLYTEQAGGARVLYYRAGDDLDEAEFVARTSRQALRDDVENTVAVLYRTNAQSRTLEDALRRAGIDYKIIGGVRFYERKEIKDTLAYLKLVLNPHDSVSLRRVINVPARGIGKGVLESLDGVALDEGTELPLLMAGLQPVVTTNSLWARLVHATEQRLLAPRALASLTAFRDLITGLAAMAARETVSIALGKVIDQSGYLQDLRDERSEEAESRIENLMELVSAAREYESRGPEPSLAGFVDQLSLALGCRRRGGRPRCTGAHDDDAQRQGARVSGGHDYRPRRRALSAFALARRPGRDGGGAATVLRGNHTCGTTTGAHVGRKAPGVRRLPIPGAVSFHRRDSPALIEEIPSTFSSPYQSQLRANPYGRGAGNRKVREEPASYAYEDEDQSAPGGLKPGLRVRHPMFGEGTVLSVEPLDGDTKLVVRFSSVGQKTLRAKFAKLELV